MRKNISKTVLLAACSFFWLWHSPEAKAGESLSTAQAVQQSKKVTGVVSDAMGPVIGAKATRRRSGAKSSPSA